MIVFTFTSRSTTFYSSRLIVLPSYQCRIISCLIYKPLAERQRQAVKMKSSLNNHFQLRSHCQRNVGVRMKQQQTLDRLQHRYTDTTHIFLTAQRIKSSSTEKPGGKDIKTHNIFCKHEREIKTGDLFPVLKYKTAIFLLPLFHLSCSSPSLRLSLLLYLSPPFLFQSQAGGGPGLAPECQVTRCFL